MSYVHVAAHYYGLHLVEAHEIFAEVIFPFHSVVKPLQSVLRVWRIYGYHVEIFHLESYYASFVVVLLYSESVAYAERLMFSEYGCAGVAFFSA